jgi:hypothetical protein
MKRLTVDGCGAVTWASLVAALKGAGLAVGRPIRAREVAPGRWEFSQEEGQTPAGGASRWAGNVLWADLDAAG